MTKHLNRRPDAPDPGDDDFEAAAATAEMMENIAATRDATEHLCYLMEKSMLQRGEIAPDDCLYQDEGDGGEP